MPDDVVFVDEIPHTATGKIQKTVLRERFGKETGCHRRRIEGFMRATSVAGEDQLRGVRHRAVSVGVTAPPSARALASGTIVSGCSSSSLGASMPDWPDLCSDLLWALWAMIVNRGDAARLRRDRVARIPAAHRNAALRLRDGANLARHPRHLDRRGASAGVRGAGATAQPRHRRYARRQPAGL